MAWAVLVRRLGAAVVTDQALQLRLELSKTCEDLAVECCALVRDSIELRERGEELGAERAEAEARGIMVAMKAYTAARERVWP